MIRGFATAQLEHDRDEGSDKLLPFGVARCAACGRLVAEEDITILDMCESCLRDYCKEVMG